MNGVQLSIGERAILEAARDCGTEAIDGHAKCDVVLRRALESLQTYDPAIEEALGSSGYEHEAVGRLYDELRSLARRGLLSTRGNLTLPAGPRYTESGFTEAARKALDGAKEEEG